MKDTKKSLKKREKPKQEKKGKPKVEKKEKIISVKEISPPIKSVRELSAKEFNNGDKGKFDLDLKLINVNGFGRRVLEKEQVDFDEPSSGFSPGSPSSTSLSGAGSINLEETALREVASHIIPEDIPNRGAPGGTRASGDERGGGQTAGAGQALGSYSGRTERLGDYESVRVMPERRRGRMPRFVEKSLAEAQSSMGGAMAGSMPAVAERVDIEKPISRLGDIELSRGVNMEFAPQASRSQPFVEPQQIGSEQYFEETYTPKYVEAPQSEALSDALSSDFFLKRRRKDDV